MKNRNEQDPCFPYPIMDATEKGVTIRNAVFEDTHIIELEEIVIDPTIEHVRWIVEHKSYRHFAWTNDDPNAQPLLIDMQTANVLKVCYEAMQKPETIKKFEDWVHGGRGTFAATIKFCWEAVK